MIRDEILSDILNMAIIVTKIKVSRHEKHDENLPQKMCWFRVNPMV